MKIQYRSTLLAAALIAATAAAHAQSVTYAVEPMHTFVTFEAKHFGTSTVRGRFDKKEGTITIDRAAKTGKADITLDTASISSGVTKFDDHLKSKDFFNVAAHPTARFVGTGFSFDGDKVKSVSGNLTLVGQTKPVTFTASHFNCYQNPMFKKEICGGDFETTIKRSEFGITYGVPNIPDEVRLVIQIEAVRQ